MRNFDFYSRTWSMCLLLMYALTVLSTADRNLTSMPFFPSILTDNIPDTDEALQYCCLQYLSWIFMWAFPVVKALIWDVNCCCVLPGGGKWLRQLFLESPFPAELPEKLCPVFKVPAASFSNLHGCSENVPTGLGKPVWFCSKFFG